MRILKLFLLSIIMSSSLFSMSIYEKEVRELLSQLKEERMIREAKEKRLSCQELATNPLEIEEKVDGDHVQNEDLCSEDKD